MTVPVASEVEHIYARFLNRRVFLDIIKKRLFRPLQADYIDPSTLHFGQQHIHTVDIFPEPYHTVPIEAFPHRKLLSGNEEPYRKYLHQSWEYWGPENTKENRDEKVEKYKQLVADIRKDGIQTPIQYFTRPDGKRVIYHGNHRSSVAHHLGIKLPAVEMPLSEFVFKRAHKTDGIPDQSVYHNGTEVIVGRRRDILDRLKLIDEADLKENYVLDFGCNIGSSAFIAAEKGASKIVGIEHEPDLVTIAIRLNIAFAHPCDFIMSSLSNPIDISREFNTGFCFPINNYMSGNRQLVENIQEHVTNTLYFETNANSSVPKEIEMLADSIQFRGTTGPNNNRKLYRSEL